MVLLCENFFLAETTTYNEQRMWGRRTKFLQQNRSFLIHTLLNNIELEFRDVYLSVNIIFFLIIY